MSSKIRLAFRIFGEWLRLRRPAVMHSVQITRLYYYKDSAAPKKTFFELKQGETLACLGGLCEGVMEENAPITALLRELREELGFDFGLSPRDVNKLAMVKEFGNTAGLKLRMNEKGEFLIGRNVIIVPEFRGPVVSHLPFGLIVKTHFFAVRVKDALPEWFELVKTDSLGEVYRVSPPAGEVTIVRFAPLQADGSVLAETSPLDWRNSAEYFTVTPPRIPDYFFPSCRQAGAEIPKGLGKSFFHKGEFYPLGTRQSLVGDCLCILALLAFVTNYIWLVVRVFI